jgi:hypothetical protein
MFEFSNHNKNNVFFTKKNLKHNNILSKMDKHSDYFRKKRKINILYVISFMTNLKYPTYNILKQIY